ncbi:MAG: biotin/lipoate A/B protein ligase family protein [Chloroflexota bacterium]|nr:biotin/lipoate A/B protein ligase family protein [Chloroflexota bacterium]
MDDSQKRPNWRLLVTEPMSGAWNMAIDEAIAEHAGKGDVPMTLRFYAWAPPCVSLGRHQPLADVDVEKCSELGYDVVRRPTGGRAILHTDELTYSVAGPQSDPILAGGVLDSYLRLSQGLLAGLEELGLQAGKAPVSNRANADAGPVCFEVPSAYEIVVGGKKLVGSAQSRRQGWVLQHGTLPLGGDITRLVDVLDIKYSSERLALKRILADRATTVGAVLEGGVGFQRAAEAMSRGFESGVAIELTPGLLSDEEWGTAERIWQEKYASDDWTGRF